MNRARAATVWAVRYGLPGAAIRTFAKRGDVVARAAVEPTARSHPAQLYPDLRALGRLGGNRLLGATARHAVVDEVLRREDFRVDPGGAPTPLLGRLLAAAVDPQALGPVDVPSLLAIQPPDHSRVRRLVSHAFTPRAIAGYTERIRAVAHDLLDRAERRAADEGRRFDIVADYAEPLPVTVIAEIMGIPSELHDDLLRIGNEAAKTLDPVLSWREFRAADRAIREGHALLDEHIAARRRQPGDDLLSELVRANDDGDRLSDDELRVNALLLIGAGFETTVNLIGNAIGLLLEHRDQLDGLRADPDRWPNAVEEVLRYEAPVQLTVRVAGRDLTLAGQDVPAGRPVVLLLGAANRDPDTFDDPDRFDVTRPDARTHLSFSAGPHYCIGAQLARLEARLALETLFERFPDLAVAGHAERRRTRVLHGYRTLPVTTRAVGTRTA